MRRERQKKILTICFVIMAVFACRLFIRKTRQVKADELPIEDIEKMDSENSEVAPFSTEGIPPKHEPTEPVRKFLGMWMTSGYALQPNEDTYTVQGREATIYTDAARSVSAVLVSLTSWPHYQWYTSTNGKKWTTMDGPTSNDRDLKVNTNTVGTVYYQQRTAWYMLLGPSKIDPTVWSNVAAVHTLDKDVDADEISVSLDDDYIYNEESEITTNTTYARAVVNPPEYTGTLKWSVDRPDLATIDENTGLITANKQSKSGKVVVTATGYNSDGKAFYGRKILTVGGGLEDQIVDVGEKGTFKLMGNIGEFEKQEDMDYSIRWFKENPMTGEQSEIEVGNNAISHTTDEATIDDDGTEYFAHITVERGGKKPPYEYDTNKAKLHVRSKEGPDIEIHDTIENTSLDNKTDADDALYDVIKGDKVNYHTTFKNKSTASRLKDATYTLPLREGSVVNKVLVDGNEVSSDDYDITNSTGNNDILVKIKGINIGIGADGEHDVEVQTTIGEIKKRDSFTSTGYLVGTDTSDNSYQKIGEARSMTLVTDELEYEITDIDYGSIKPIGNDKIIYRKNDESNWPNNIIKVDDMRRNKSATQLYLTQRDDFKDNKGEGNNRLQGHLKFVDNNGDGQTDLMSDSALVAYSGEGEAMNSQSWRADKGVLLEMDNKMNVSGNYKADLDWTFVDSVENV